MTATCDKTLPKKVNLFSSIHFGITCECTVELKVKK